MVTVTALAAPAREARFGLDEIIVSKTDIKGRITYVNKVFVSISGYDRDELLGQPHSIIRHPDMPRAVFKLLWDTIQGGKEIFAYLKNATKDGNYYWVLAHVTPTYAADGQLVGYHSNRRCPDREAITRVEPLYRTLRGLETGPGHKADAAARSLAHLLTTLGKAGMDYETYVWRLIHGVPSGLGDD